MRPELLHRISAWLFDDALPFWADAAWDPSFGGAIEELGFDGRDAGLPIKRTRVICRQIYVFSHAATMGWTDGFAAIARAADFLTTRIWQGDARGFATLMTREGAVHDSRANLYDAAFAALAFAWALRATGDGAHRDWLTRTFAFIERELRHASGIGYENGLNTTGWRLQNPHMHLLEASIAAFDATGEAEHRSRIEALADLCRRSFVDPQGALGEYFAEDWSPASPPDGDRSEPGHAFEWVWLLNEARRVTGGDFRQTQERLFQRAESYGLNPGAGAVKAAIDRHGRTLNAHSRLWPNTERLKAGLALEGSGAPSASTAAETLFAYYLSPRAGRNFPRGAWIDAIHENGAPLSERIPASTLYHLFLAFTEALRAHESRVVT